MCIRYIVPTHIMHRSILTSNHVQLFFISQQQSDVGPAPAIDLTADDLDHNVDSVSTQFFKTANLEILRVR